MQQNIYDSHSSDREFLFHKSNLHQEDARKTLKTKAIPELLQQSFPEISSGQSLIESALNQLDSSLIFAVMLIRIGIIENESLTIIDEFCKQERGVWGFTEPDIIGCFFPDKSSDVCLQFAENLRKKIPILIRPGIYIGIASYPQANFTRDRIVENAQKALNQAMLSEHSDIIAFNAVSLNISGDKYYQEGHIHKAIDEFKTAMLLEPSNVNIHNSLGVCYGSLGAYQSALDEFETAMQIAPDDMMAYYNAGLVTLMMGEAEKALNYFQQASNIGEDVFEAAFQTGKLYMKLGNPEKSKEFLEKAVSLKPDSAAGWRCLGECRMMLNLIEEAVHAYKKVIKISPSDAEALSTLGYLFNLQNENSEIALTFCQHSVEIAPENGLFRNRLGRVYFRQNHLKEALNEFQKASELGYESAEWIAEIISLSL